CSVGSITGALPMIRSAVISPAAGLSVIPQPVAVFTTKPGYSAISEMIGQPSAVGATHAPHLSSTFEDSNCGNSAFILLNTPSKCSLFAVAVATRYCSNGVTSSIVHDVGIWKEFQ